MKISSSGYSAFQLVLMLCASSSALAQEIAAQPASDNSYGDIVVTAQKREQRLNDVGITITAATGAQLQAAGVRNVADLPKLAPGLTAGTNYNGYPIFSLRGVNFNAAQIASPPAVSTYVDEAPLPYPTMTAGALFDLERVEVLKGPQGTLFGQNATGGSINLIAAKPTRTPTAGLSGEVNNFGEVQFEGFVSGPLSETLAARIAVSTAQFGAWQRGYYAHREKNGDQNRLNARILLDWRPSDTVRISLNVSPSYDHSETIHPQLSLVSPANPAANPAPGLIGYPQPKDNRDTDFTLGRDYHKRNWQIFSALRADLDLGDNVTLTSITDYIHTKIFLPQDSDGTAIPLLFNTAGGTVKSIVQELRITGKAIDGRLNYVIGGSYQNDKIFDHVIHLFTEYTGLPSGAIIDQPYNLTNRAAAAFGNLDFEAVPRLTFTAGVRYTATRQSVNGCLTGNAQTAGTLGFIAGLNKPGVESSYIPGQCLTIDNTGLSPSFRPVAANLVQKQNNVAWRLGINYKIDDEKLIYALVSRGYKAGTFPVSDILFQTQLHRLSQEELTAYEAGVKLGVLDRRLQVNIAAFYYDYRDKQFFTWVPVPIVRTAGTLINIPKSDVRGLDFELIARPVDGLTLRGAGTYVKTHVKNFSSFNSLAQLVNYDGKEFNYAPPWSLTFDAEYQIPVSETTRVVLGMSGLYNDRTFSDLGENAADLVPARTVLDARLGLVSNAGWRVGAFVRNLTNAVYWNSTAYSGDTIVKNAGMPRTYGLSAGITF